MTSTANFEQFSRSSGFTLKMQVVVTTFEFDPSSLLITNRLIPVAINLFPAPQQTLWLYNFYTIDVEMKLISCSPELSLVDELFVVKSRQHAPLFLTFTPSYVGDYEVNCHQSTTNRIPKNVLINYIASSRSKSCSMGARVLRKSTASAPDANKIY